MREREMIRENKGKDHTEGREKIKVELMLDAEVVADIHVILDSEREQGAPPCAGCGEQHEINTIDEIVENDLKTLVRQYYMAKAQEKYR